MPSNKSAHILSTPSNLPEFYLLVLTFIKISRYSQSTLIDESKGVASILLIIASILSSKSMRSYKEKQSENFENIADLIFLSSLIIIFTITFLVAFLTVF